MYQCSCKTKFIIFAYGAHKRQSSPNRLYPVPPSSVTGHTLRGRLNLEVKFLQHGLPIDLSQILQLCFY